MSGKNHTAAMRCIGDMCRQHRKTRRLKLREVAAQADISISHLCEIEHGLKSPSFMLAVRLCSVLEIDVRELADSVWLKLTDDSGGFK